MKKVPKTEDFGVIPVHRRHRFREVEVTLSCASKLKLKERVVGEKGEKSFTGHFRMASPRLPVLMAVRVYM